MITVFIDSDIDNCYHLSWVNNNGKQKEDLRHCIYAHLRYDKYTVNVKTNS